MIQDEHNVSVRNWLQIGNVYPIQLDFIFNNYPQKYSGGLAPPAHGRWALAVSHLWGPSVSSN